MCAILCCSVSEVCRHAAGSGKWEGFVLFLCVVWERVFRSPCHFPEQKNLHTGSWIWNSYPKTQLLHLEHFGVGTVRLLNPGPFPQSVRRHFLSLEERNWRRNGSQLKTAKEKYICSCSINYNICFFSIKLKSGTIDPF